ncbi:MAG TPA: YggS family pyridoxal phosphate enzyme [Solirubrobacteraceae bacterium]|nr:YggS family pyridoxal phosphate enzyme [Solirubrobacteraceae bacterium]
MASLITGLSEQRIRDNLERARGEIARAAPLAGRRAEEVEILAAVKYVATEELPVLARAGIELVGENRSDALREKTHVHGDLFAWDFIGTLQSRRVREIVPHVRLIHSLASESALRELGRHAASARPGLEALLQVNVAGEPGKAGVVPDEVGRFLEASPVPITGLMTMPPLAVAAEDSRRWFAQLRSLADHHGLERLSMGTSQDFTVAVEEGATIVRIGTNLYR